jgi:hypothetical protein
VLPEHRTSWVRFQIDDAHHCNHDHYCGRLNVDRKKGTLPRRTRNILTWAPDLCLIDRRERSTHQGADLCGPEAFQVPGGHCGAIRREGCQQGTVRHCTGGILAVQAAGRTRSQEVNPRPHRNSLPQQKSIKLPITHRRKGRKKGWRSLVGTPYYPGR